MFSFSSFSSVLIKLTHLDKFPLHRNVVSGKLGSGQLAFIIIEMLISRAFFPSSPGPLYQNEVKCSAFDMKMIFHSHANKTHFHKKGCAPSLILKVRVFGTRKWPIRATPLETAGDWVQVFRATTSGMVWVGKRWQLLVNGIQRQQVANYA